MDNINETSTEKAIHFLETQREQLRIKRTKEEIALKNRYEGIEEGIDIAEKMLYSIDFEATLNQKSFDEGYSAGIKDALYEFCKELDISSEDIRESDLSLDEKCAKLAERLR